MTHEQFIHAVRDIIAAHASDAAVRTKLLNIKLTYGASPRTRGVTYFDQWRNLRTGNTVDFATISAMGEQSLVQLAGTTIHEMAHVVAGKGAGHDQAWRDMCVTLGLRLAKAVGTRYTWASFAPAVRDAIYRLGDVSDGIPTFQEPPPGDDGTVGTAGAYVQYRAVACTHGIGTRGGRSRGTGSGSRMRKYVCGCGQIIRAATSTLDATHNACGGKFTLA